MNVHVKEDGTWVDVIELLPELFPLTIAMEFAFRGEHVLQLLAWNEPQSVMGRIFCKWE